jgi:protein-S-isoprenylcysteine O-methyltransferase Ste14
MTAWGVGRGLGRITYSYLAFTIILHIIRPDIFTITQIPFLASAILGTILIIIGLVMWALGARIIRKAFHEGRLLTKGVYAIVRNPMYSGLIVFISPGIALWFRSWLIFTVPIVAYIAFKLLIKEEENYLKEEFGQEYLDYKSKVNALIPFPHFSK